MRYRVQMRSPLKENEKGVRGAFVLELLKSAVRYYANAIRGGVIMELQRTLLKTAKPILFSGSVENGRKR